MSAGAGRPCGGTPFWPEFIRRLRAPPARICVQPSERMKLRLTARRRASRANEFAPDGRIARRPPARTRCRPAQAGLVAARPFGPNSCRGCERRRRESASSERMKLRLTAHRCVSRANEFAPDGRTARRPPARTRCRPAQAGLVAARPFGPNSFGGCEPPARICVQPGSTRRTQICANSRRYTPARRSPVSSLLPAEIASRRR